MKEPVMYPDPTASSDVRESGCNTASLVLGVVSLVSPFVGMITGPLAVFLYLYARREWAHNGVGLAGFVTGAIATCLYLAFLTVALLVWWAMPASVYG